MVLKPSVGLPECAKRFCGCWQGRACRSLPACGALGASVPAAAACQMAGWHQLFDWLAGVELNSAAAAAAAAFLHTSHAFSVNPTCAGVEAGQIDLIVMATSSPDDLFGSATSVQVCGAASAACGHLLHVLRCSTFVAAGPSCSAAGDGLWRACGAVCEPGS